MAEFVVYILWSDVFSKTYIGCTGNLISRFLSHNVLGKKGWTVRYRPWRVVYVKFFNNKQKALEYESFLKTGVGRAWISKHVDFN
ncbi:MAG: GIY-YIG nuclease family protein [Altibacter sp.]|uniref:GIY-YIG nuclease family protein n=1 Tax=Altibacter sp. TaxID=2024823 RepID=UPI001E156530|nr:GIY-YIG nuclease family protein [Altibacter sp.]MBZ0326807.1 GIY-YIG nuclease family protein [Altibacter sp.]